jgi:hypothetical protein
VANVGIDTACTTAGDFASEAARYPLIEKFDNLQSCWQGADANRALTADFLASKLAGPFGIEFLDYDPPRR